MQMRWNALWKCFFVIRCVSLSIDSADCECIVHSNKTANKGKLLQSRRELTFKMVLRTFFSQDTRATSFLDPKQWWMRVKKCWKQLVVAVLMRTWDVITTPVVASFSHSLRTRQHFSSLDSHFPNAIVDVVVRSNRHEMPFVPGPLVSRRFSFFCAPLRLMTIIVFLFIIVSHAPSGVSIFDLFLPRKKSSTSSGRSTRLEWSWLVIVHPPEIFSF